MKKILSLIVVFLTMIFSGKAQYLLQEGFETGTLPTGWTVVDSDGDGYTWDASFLYQNESTAHTGDGMIASASYINNLGALTPDNWLISPAVNLSANATLTFWVCAQDANYAAEHYGVYISTTGTATSNFTLLFEETLDANGGMRTQGAWKQKTVDLASYTGQTVYIAFRHFNCTDMFWLDLDDVEIFAQPTDPTIIANPTTLDFGTLAIGNSQESTAVLTSYNLTADVTATTAAPFYVSADGINFSSTATIAATGDTLYVRYTPTIAGTDYGIVTLSSTGADDVTVTLTGTAIDCSNTPIPITEGFESTIDCWTMVSMDPANDDEFGIYADANAYDGEFDFRFSSYSSASDYNQYLITPELTLESTENYLVRFFYKGYNSSENFKVMYSTTNNNISSFTELSDYTNVATSWTEVILELPAGTKYVAIDYYGNYQYYLYIDNFSIMTATPSMSLSENAMDFGINEMGSTSDAQYVVMNTINVNETFLLGTAAPFEISLDGTNFAATQTIPANTTMVVYDTIFVRFAPAAAGTFNGNLTVTSTSYNDSVALTGESVDCTPGITVPYTQNFNDNLVPPVCWSIGYDPEIFMSLGVDDTNYCIGIQGVDMLITPEIHSTDAILVSFDYINYASTSATAPTYFHVGYSTTDNNPSSFTWQGENLCATDAFEAFSTVVPAGTKYVAVGASQIGTFLYWGISEMEDIFFIDNLTLTDQTEPLMTVTPESMSFGSINLGAPAPVKTASVIGALLTSNISVTTPANFEVSTNGTSYTSSAILPQEGGTLYVRYNPSSAGAHSGTVTLTSGSITKTITVSGSAVDCSTPNNLPFFEGFENGLPQCWQNIDNDGDDYAWESSLDYGIEGYEGDGCLMSASYINDIGALNPDNWLVTPALVIPSQGAILTWYVATRDPDWPSEFYEVKLSTTPNINDFTTVFSETLVSNEWEQRFVNIDGNWAGQTVYIAFQHHNVSDMYWMKIDNISVAECFPPASLTVQEVTTTSATVNWQGNNSSSYNLRYRLAGDNEWTIVTGITDLTYTISGLVAGNYEVEVAIACDSANWTPTTFTIIEVLSNANWYGYNTYNHNYYDWGRRFVSFSMQNPTVVTPATSTLLTSSGDAYTLAAAYANGYVWCITQDGDLNRATLNNSTKTISEFETIISGFENALSNSMSYNPVDGRIYYNVYNDRKLKSFDPKNPEDATEIGTYNIDVLAFAINSTGEAYCIEINTGNLYQLNLGNASTTLIGNTGRDVYYAQSMAFDLQTNELFWAQYYNYNNCGLYKVDTSTAATYYISQIGDGNGVEFTGLFMGDDVEISCPAPSELAVSNIEVHSVSLNWTENGDASEWQLCINNDTTNLISVNTTSYTLTGLATGTNYTVKVRANCNSAGHSYWSNIVTFTTKLCPAPQNVSVYNIGMTGATVTWFSDAESFTIEYGEAGFTPGTGIIETVTTNTYDLDGLTAGTNYTIYITADCGGEGFSSPASFNFNSAICEVADQCAYTFNLTDSYGDGWNGGYLDVQQNGVTVATLGLPSGSSATETVNLCDNVSTSLEWTAGSYANEAGFSVAGPDGAEIYSVSTMTGYSTYTFTSSCTMPTCPRPADITVSNVGATSAEISWTLTGTEVAWNVEYKVNTDATWTVVPVTTNPYTLTNLNAATNYNVRVQADCGNGDVSDYRETSFMTACDVVTVYPYVEGFEYGLGCWQSVESTYTNYEWVTATADYYYTTMVEGSYFALARLFSYAAATVRLLSPIFDLTSISNPYVRFAHAQLDWGGDQDELSVYYRASTADEWTLLVNYTNSISSFTYDSVALPNPSATYQLSFVASNSYGYGVALDDVQVYDDNGSGPVVTNPTVTTTAATAVTQTTATLNATIENPDGVTVTAKGFEWKATNGGTYTQIAGTGTDNTFTADLAGLTANTNYTYKAFIIYNGTTVYGSEVSFTTLENGIPAGDALPCPGHETVTDYDGNVYNTVKIGEQCWMKENLRVTHYADGVTIPLGDSISTTVPYYYVNPNLNEITHGYFYNWPAVMHGLNSSNSNPSNVQGICPAGWHVPSDAEWTQLTDYVSSIPAYWCGGDNNNIAKALASTEGWGSYYLTECVSDNNLIVNNITGFSALPSGYSYYENDGISYGGYGAYFWCATEYGSSVWSRYILYYQNNVDRYFNFKEHGFSVRCVLGDVAAVSTRFINKITNTTALSGGTVTYNNNTVVTERGVCWSTSPNPTISDNHTINGNGSGSFLSDITGLAQGTTYYVRAYATTNSGTVYGEDLSFTTLSIPEGDAQPCPGHATLTDYDGNTYNTVKIGNQCWMKENLKTTHYADGIEIPLGDTTSFTSPYRYYPDNSTNNVAEFGYLYNWQAAMHGAAPSNENPSEVQGICPTGWHLPSDEEWTQLTDYVSSVPDYVCGTDSTNIARALAIDEGWTLWGEYNNCCVEYQSIYANNLTGFSAIPAGSFHNFYDRFGASVSFWSTSEYSATEAWHRYIGNIYSYVYRGIPDMDYGLSVRCLLDSPCLSLSSSEFFDTGCESYVWSGTTYTQSGDYTQTFTNAEGCDSVVTLHLTVNATPVVTVTASETTLCEGGSVTLTASVEPQTAYNYQWHKIVNGVNTLVSGATSDSYTTSDLLLGNSYEFYVVVTNSISSCSTISDTVSVNVTAAPTVTIQGGNTSCEGENLILNAFISGGVAGATYNYTWNWTGPTTGYFVSQTPSFIPNLPADPVNPYYITVTISRNDNTVCTATSAVHTVNIVPAPTVSVTADNAYICQNGEVTFTANVYPIGSYNYVWTINGQQQAVNSATVTISATTIGNINAQVVVSSAYAGCSATVTLDNPVHVVAAPTLTLSADHSSMCAGGTTTLSAAVNASPMIPNNFNYEWIFDNGTPVPGVTNSYNLTLNDAGNHTVQARVTQNNLPSCMSSLSNVVNVQVAEQPVVSLNILNGSTICSGGTTTLNGVVTNYGNTVNGVTNSSIYGAMTFNWTSNGVSLIYQANMFTNQSQVDLTMNMAGNYTCQVEVTPASYNCLPQTSNSVTFSVVNDPFWTNVSVSGSNNSHLCLGETVSLAASIQGGIFNGEGTNGHTQWVVTDGNGNTANVTSGTGGNAYDIPATSGVYVYTPTFVGDLGNGCQITNTNDVQSTVTVHELPTARFTDSNVIELCDNDSNASAQMTVAFTGVAPFSFIVTGNDQVVVEQSSIMSNTATFYVSPSVNTTYHIQQVTDSYCENPTLSTDAYVSVILVGCGEPQVITNPVDNIGSSSATCGGSVTYSGGASIIARGVCWSTSQNPTIADAHTTDGNGMGAFTSTINGLTPNTNYYVRAYATNDIGTSYGQEVAFTTLCDTVIVAINEAVNFNESVILTATGANSYVWSTGATTESITVSPTESSIYSVTGTDIYGCWASTSVTVALNQMNAFDARVFPNPTTGQLHLQVTDTAVLKGNNNISVFVYDATGHLAIKTRILTPVTELSLLPYRPGIYFLEFNINGITVKKFKVVKV